LKNTHTKKRLWGEAATQPWPIAPRKPGGLAFTSGASWSSQIPQGQTPCWVYIPPLSSNPARAEALS